MKKKYSIKENKDVQKILNEGKFSKCNSCIVYVMRNNSDKNNVAFLAGKKLGNAPIRNKAKRKLRAAMRTYWADLAKGYDVVIIARPFLLHMEQDILLNDLESLLKKHKILNTSHNGLGTSTNRKVGNVKDEKTI